jgi:hypothetical protein
MRTASLWTIASVSLQWLAGALPASAATTDIRTLRTNVFRAITDDPNTIPLTARAVVPPSGSPSSGSATVSVNTTSTQFNFNITHNVPGETSAAIRGPAYAYENGPILFALPLGSPKIGSWPISPANLATIKEGRVYIEIRSASFPSGAIRCQIQASNPPVDGRPIWVRVLVENLGPDTYVGSEPNKLLPNNMFPSAAAGRLQITVDIDEPTKPTLLPDPRIAVTNITRDFALTLAPFDSVELDLGVVPGYVAHMGSLSTDATGNAQAPNIDPNASNNSVHDLFYVGGPLPALGVWFGVAIALAMLALGGIWIVRRRRLGPDASGGPA